MTPNDAIQRLTVGLCLLAGSGLTGNARLAAEDFRVENKVYLGGEKEPKVQSTTVFYAGIVYDYLESPPEITVFDKGRGRFILLDTNKRIKTEMTTDEISAVNKNVKQWALSRQDPYLQWLAEPKLEEQFDEAKGELSFTSSWLTYRIVPTEVQSPELAREYRDFSDWHTLLNTRLNPGSKLPFTRLIVNEALQKRNLLPKEVHLTARAKRGLPFQKTTVRSEHHLVRHLVQSDHDRIKQTDEYMAIFPAVDFQRYQKSEP